MKRVRFCHPANIAHALVKTMMQQRRNSFYLQSISAGKVVPGESKLEKKHETLISLAAEDDLIY